MAFAVGDVVRIVSSSGQVRAGGNVLGRFCARRGESYWRWWVAVEGSGCVPFCQVGLDPAQGAAPDCRDCPSGGTQG